MCKIAAVLALALLASVAVAGSDASAQAPPAAQPPAAAPPPAADAPAKSASPRKRKVRHASRHRRRHAGAVRCFAHEWRAFPTRDPKGYFYTPPGGGIC